jgi:hypothetical protein
MVRVAGVGTAQRSMRICRLRHQPMEKEIKLILVKTMTGCSGHFSRSGKYGYRRGCLAKVPR